MKVFISWSGPLSHKIACELREWLPLVIQSIDPYVSSEDIDKGTRWSTDIGSELEDSNFGILCVTPDNKDAPWINFEAGALAKSFSKSNVIPFLFGLKPSDMTKSPLLQFQSVLFDEKDVKKMVLSLNKALDVGRLDETKIEKTWEMWWPKLNDKLADLSSELKVESTKSEKDKNSKESNAVLEELLNLSREQLKIISSPEMLLPVDYYSHLNKMVKINRYERVLDDLKVIHNSFSTVYAEIDLIIDSKEMNESIIQLEKIINYLEGRSSLRRQPNLGFNVVSSKPKRI